MGGESPRGHFLSLSLEGTRSNRDAVGARVVVHAGGRARVAPRLGGGSFQSAGDPRLHFGLGACDRVDRIGVRRTSGRVDRHSDLAADRGDLPREGEAAARPLRGFARRGGSNCRPGDRPTGGGTVGPSP
jgi:hypothetical protein